MVTNSNTNTKYGLLSAQSVGNKTLDIQDLIKEKDFDVLAVTKTQLNNYDTAKICKMTPAVTHTFLHVPQETGWVVEF